MSRLPRAQGAGPRAAPPARVAATGPPGDGAPLAPPATVAVAGPPGARAPLASPATVAAAYSAAGAAWAVGPSRVYDRLAAALVAASPVSLAGRTVLDLGAGTGAASRAIAGAGGRPVAVDAAIGMLAVARADRPPAVQADVLDLPIANAVVGGVVAAFSLNHLADPVAGFVEAARVVAAGGVIIAGAYAATDSHPAKAAADRALVEWGWAPPAWYAAVRDHAVPRLATEAAMAEVAAAAGLVATTTLAVVRFPDLGPPELVAWRLGMAHTAWFVADLDPGERARLHTRAVELLGDAPPLERHVVVATAVV